MSEIQRRLATLAGEDEWTRHRTLEELRSGDVPPSEIHDLQRCLAHDNATIRASARMALAALATPGSLSHAAAQAELRSALRSDEEDVRVLAASALGEAEDAGAGPALVEALSDRSSNVVAAAADALGALSYAPALDALAGLCAAGDLWLRAAAVVALGRLEDERAIPVLAELATERGLEKPIAEALARIDHPDALAVLERTRAAAPDLSLRAAGRVLAAHPDTPPPPWVTALAREREDTLRAELVREDEPGVARLVGLAGSAAAVECLVDLVGAPRRSEAAIAGLLAVAPEARVAAILARVEAAEPREMATLLSLLPPLSEAARIRELVPLLGHASAAVRGAAAEALARSPASEALPFLAEEMSRERVAPEVIRALGGLGAAACSSLVPLLRDPSAPVRRAAASALIRCASRDIEGELRSALSEEEDPEVRDALIGALAQAAGAGALDVLEEALRSQRVETRLAAIDGLGATGAEAAVAPLGRALRGSRAEEFSAIRALGELALPAALPLLRPRLAADDPDVRRAAARAAVSLADGLDPESVERLASDADALVRTYAARILARRGARGRSALEAMAAEDPDPDVRSAARRGLGESV